MGAEWEGVVLADCGRGTLRLGSREHLGKDAMPVQKGPAWSLKGGGLLAVGLGAVQCTDVTGGR